MKIKTEAMESQGKCYLCGGTYTKRDMEKHLEECKQHSSGASKSGKTRKTRLFHILVEGTHLPEYWLHIEAPADATLEGLDDFLREKWLECCGHLSSFTVGKAYYESSTGGVDGMWAEGSRAGAPIRSMRIKLENALRVGREFYHLYDFGTHTDLTLRVLSEREGKFEKEIVILSRNLPPPLKCVFCGKTATQVWTERQWGEGWICDECAKKHECDEDVLLPMANSPRVGVCGYCGEGEGFPI